MNKRSIITKSIMITMGMVGMAFSAKNAPQYSLSNNWTGLYAGVEAGFVFNNIQLKSQQLGFTTPGEHCNTSLNLSSFFPGMQLGYMYQFPHNLVAGIEANVSFNAKQEGILSCTCNFNFRVSDRFSFRNQMQSSIKGRLGHALNWKEKILLPYLTAGSSLARAGLTYQNEGNDYYSQKTTHGGLLLGAGIEWSFKQHWSLRAEYSHVNAVNTIKLKIPSVYGLADPDGNARVNLKTNNILIAISYWI